MNSARVAASSPLGARAAAGARQGDRVPPLYAHDPFLLIQSTLGSPWLDFPMSLLSTACEGWSLALIAVALVWSLERRREPTIRFSLPVLAALLAAGLVAQLLKRLVHLPRPLSVLGPSGVHVVLEPLGQLAFPSGHAAAAAAMATALTVRYGGRVGWVWALAFLGGLSRVYVGSHWGMDVAAGWLVGTACGLTAALALRGRCPRLAAARARASTPEAA